MKIITGIKGQGNDTAGTKCRNQHDSMMEGNVLGSGPSRKSYIPNDLPSIGCNFPWTRVNWTIIFDEPVIDKLVEQPNLISIETKLILHSRLVPHLTVNHYTSMLRPRIDSIFSFTRIEEKQYYISSGHYAALWMINKGFNKLNLYGMDNYFGDLVCGDNYTHIQGTQHYLPNTVKDKYSEQQILARGHHWKDGWDLIQKQHSHVEFNFVR